MTARTLLPTLLALAACASPDSATPLAGGSTAPVATLTQGLSAADQVACGFRWVGSPDAAGCPAGTADWALVSLTTPAVAGTDLGDRLNSYCMYDWIGAASTPNPGTLPSLGAGRNFGPDCHVVGTAGSLTIEMGQYLRDTYYKGVARPASLPPTGVKTSLAVIDTSPTDWLSGQPGGGQFEHGRSVATAARRLSCFGGNCIVDVIPTLGLPRVAPKTVDTIKGGAFGHQSELAHGIIEAVDRWKKHTAGQRLVINLSVGWESRFNVDPDSGLTRPSVDMVYDALQYARCHGALIFAAAGNKGFDPFHDDGPIYPAAWASEFAPNDTDCTGIGIAYPNDVRVNPTDPLVVPVSGLTRYDEPLDNARANTRTPLEAPGANITVWDVQNGGMRPAYTGSSMATAAVSAAAATLWSYRPQTPPHVVINQLHLAGVDLGVAADICHGQTCLNSRRISMCTALNALCAQADSLCFGFSTPCQPVAAGADFAPAVSAADRASMISNITHDVLVSSTNTTAAAYECKEVDVAYDPAVSAANHLCHEDVTGHRLRPWVDPQPQPFGCDICSFMSHWTYMRFFFDPQAPTYQVTDAVLYLTDGTDTQGFDVGALDASLTVMNPDTTYKVQTNTSFSGPVIKGWIEYKVGNLFLTDDIVVY